MNKNIRNKLLGEKMAKEMTPKNVKDYRESNLLGFIDKFKDGDMNVHRALTHYNPNDTQPTYNSALGKFEQNGKTGALSDFIKPGANTFDTDLTKAKDNAYKTLTQKEDGPFVKSLKNVQSKGRNNNLDDRNTRNYVWNKVLNNRRKGKKDYEDFSTSDIIVAEDKRAQLKKVSREILKTSPKTEVVKPKIKVELPNVRKLTVQEEIQNRIARKPDPLRGTIFGTDAFYLRNKGII